MSFLQSFVNKLRSDATPLRIVEGKDGRVYTEQYQVGGDKAEIKIEYFDGRPQQASGDGWRCNKDGREF